MSIFSRKTHQDEGPPWYAAGLAFECQQCGRCCSGPEEGYVWAKPDEITAIAEFLGMDVKEMRRRYVRRIALRHSLRESPKTKDCIFLKPDGEGNLRCSIYPVRPMQCRTWPFWASNLTDPDAWALAQRRCAGINRGQVFSQDAIEAKVNVTRE